MPIQVRDSGTDKTVQSVYAQESGTDKEVQEVIVHDSGVDKTAFTASIEYAGALDTFEDGDISDWYTPDGYEGVVDYSNDSNAPPSPDGSDFGLSTYGGGTTLFSKSAGGLKYSEILWYIYIPESFSNGQIDVVLRDTSNLPFAKVTFFNDNEVYVGGASDGQVWLAGVWHLCNVYDINFDFRQYRFEIDGISSNVRNFEDSSASDWGPFEIQNNDTNKYAYFDSIVYRN